MFGCKQAVAIIPILSAGAVLAFNVNTVAGFNDNEATAVVIEGDNANRPQLGSTFNYSSASGVNHLGIVNGETATPHEFPWMVALMNLRKQFCGGSLIDETHILTAAHCVSRMSKYDVQKLRVRLGDHNIRDRDRTSVEKHVKRIIRHKQFSFSTLHYDVAILTLASPVEYSTNIQPISLASGSQSYVNIIMTVTGWGTIKEGGYQPAELMKADVKVWSNGDCKRSYGRSAPGGITGHMLCASGDKTDSCSGDSGGPLFHCPRDSCEQVGITSWGIGCAEAKYPGVYTRVTEVRPWIERIIQHY